MSQGGRAAAVPLISSGPGDSLRLIKIEQLAKERLAPPFSVPEVLIVVIIPALLKGDAALVGVPVQGISGGAASGRALDQLVEFPAIQPDAATLGAIVDFNTLALGHVQVDVTGWTLYGCIPFSQAPVGDQMTLGRRGHDERMRRGRELEPSMVLRHGDRREAHSAVRAG
jgi:hypothetical protein